MKLFKLLVCIGLINVIVACSDAETSSGHISKAKEYVTGSKVEEGLIELKNALKKEPENAEARFLLGQLYLQQGSGVDAVKELEKALQYKYALGKVIPLLARAYILDQSDEAVIGLSEQAESLPEEIKIHYLAYKTLAAIRVQNMALAKESVAIVNQLSSSNIYSLLASSYLYLAETKLVEAKAKVSQLLKVQELQPDALLLLGQIETALGDYSSATEYYLKYAQVQPKSAVIVLFITDSLLKEKKYSEAEKYADSVLAKVPNQPFAHYVKSVARFEFQDYTEAGKHAEQALLANFNQLQLRLIAGASAYYQNNFEQSYFHLNKVIEFLVPEHPARKLYAVSQLQLGLIDQINETLNNFSSTTKEDSQFLSSLSFQMAELGAIDDAKELVQSIDKGGKSAEQNVRDGILKLMLNDPTGIQNLKDAIELKPDLASAELALAYASIQGGDFEQALTISKKWKVKYPDKPVGYSLLSAVYIKQGKIAEAKAELTQSLNYSPNNLFALTELINIAYHQQNLDEAYKLSDLALKQFPENVKLLKQSYAISRGDDSKKAKVSNKIQALFESKQTDLSYGMLYAEVLLDVKNYKEAGKILDSFKVSIKSPKRFWLLKVITQNNIDKGAQVPAILELWIKSNPYHIEPNLLLINYYMRSKNSKQALVIVNKALRDKHKNSSHLKMAKMQILLNEKQLVEAKEFYKEFISNDMNIELVHGIEGRIYSLEKNYIKAEPLLVAFYNILPSSQNAILVAVAQKELNNLNKAITSLEAHLQKNEDDNQVKSLLANFYTVPYPKKAIKVYEEILLTKPNDIVYLNNLAWLYLNDNNLTLALKYSAEAVKLAPKYPNVLDTRGMVLLKSGDKVASWKALLKAYNLSKNKDANIALNYAEVLIANGQNKDAISILKRLNINNIEEDRRKKSLMELVK